MRTSFYFLFLTSIGLLGSCSNLQKTHPNSISLEFLGAAQPDSIKLVSFNNSEGVVAKNGNPYIFNFNNTIHDAFVIDVFNKGEKYSKKIFLDGKGIKIQAELTLETFKIDTVIGSDIYYKSLAYSVHLADQSKEPINNSTLNEFLLQSLKENLSHPFSFEISHDFLERNKNYKSKLRTLKTILDAQPESLKTHALSIHRTLEALIKTEFLDLSTFQFYGRNGEITKVNLSHNSDYLLDFWFVQCPPCIKDHKKIAKNLNLFSDNNVELIGISIDTVSEKWLNYLEKNNYNWQNYRELRRNKGLVEAMDVWEFPTYILINNNREIKTKFYSFEEMENYFGQL